jgi:hypothetical protein
VKLRPFAADGRNQDHGDLDHHLGWLEALAHDEEETINGPGPKQRRLDKVLEAIQLLTEASEM